MTRKIINILLAFAASLVLSGCAEDINSAPLFWFDLTIHFDENFSEDITITSDYGNFHQKAETDKENKTITVHFDDPESTYRKDGLTWREYRFDIKGQNIETGTYLRIVPDESWAEIEAIYDCKGNEIVFDATQSGYTITLN